MFRKLQRTGAGRGIDIVEMHDLLAHARLFHKLQRDVVILEPLQPRPQRPDPDRKAEAHLQPRVKALEIGLVAVQRRRHHLVGKGLLRMPIEAAHDPAHVDALLARLQAHRPRHAGLERDVPVVAGMEPDRQAKVRDAHMLDARPRPADQARGPVLQIGHRGAIGLVSHEVLRVRTHKCRIVRHVLPRQEPRDHRVERDHLLGRHVARPAAQERKRRFRLCARRFTVDIGGMDVHRGAFLARFSVRGWHMGRKPSQSTSHADITPL